ncbi:MAG: hypothetical protein E5W81_08985 [Mesorhizobium sp.]|uniref:hypothetical protein n=1 Tax=Mesorhizobium sp. TaxID=1871066 RepID=UPI0012236A95|nr:hypothetical protein [Mesorhizobium sp.]TIT20194.1 MAG: hypothetical protein E5W70_22305 [Mesorhizobium sp.]TKB88085.1 MAG: hypothetical protein E5W81_08985 [Mesorhizobium sp.]
MLTEPGLGRLSFIEFQMPTPVEMPPKVFHVFNLLHLNGRDLREAPLLEPHHPSQRSDLTWHAFDQLPALLQDGYFLGQLK